MASSNSPQAAIKEQLRTAWEATMGSPVLNAYVEELTDEELEDSDFVEGEAEKIDAYILAALVLKKLLADNPTSPLASVDRVAQLAQVHSMLFDVSDDGNVFIEELYNNNLVDVRTGESLSEAVAEWSTLKTP